MSDSNISAPFIKNLFKNQRYETEDLSMAERVYAEKCMPKPRTPRSDLVAGNIVVVLEGIHTSKKVVFIKQLPNNLALVSGVTSINGVGAFKIDERFLFKLNAKIDIQLGNVNEDVYESRIDASEDVKVESNSSALEESLMKSIQKVEFMKAYLAEPFSVDHTVEFYSIDY